MHLTKQSAAHGLLATPSSQHLRFVAKSLLKQGFTLLEILVALAVMSIVVLAFLRGNASMIANADYLRDKTLAGWVAMNRAAELRLAGQWLGAGGAEGTNIMADRAWRWRATGKVSPDPDMQIVTIEGRPGEGESNTPLASLTMFLGQASVKSP